VLRDTTPPGQVQALWYQVRKKVGDMRHTLPTGVRGPFFDDEYSDVWSAVYAVTGADNAELVRQAERIRAPPAARAGRGEGARSGEQPQRIHVEVAHARLATLGIQPQAILDALARHNPVAPAGVVETRRRACICASAAASTGSPRSATCRSRPPRGARMRLGDIAEVRAASPTRPPPASATAGGMRCCSRSASSPA
jgi:multidrug efflux pump